MGNLSQPQRVDLGRWAAARMPHALGSSVVPLSLSTEREVLSGFSDRGDQGSDVVMSLTYLGGSERALFRFIPW